MKTPTPLHSLLTRGVDTIYPTRKALDHALMQKKLTVYLGIDPTGNQIHIGHTIPARKLRQFQKAGHKTILLIGDFTAQIGDPTGKDKARVPLTPAQVQEHCQTYKEQLGKILDFEDAINPTEIRYNSEWLGKLTMKEILELASKYTVQQMIERDMFQERIKAKKPIGLHEFLYPLMQGYDTVVLDADVEIGGTDQTFNMLAGRTLLKSLKNKEKFVITVPLLTDSTGKKIGKTEGNVIGITDAPNDFYGKIMSLSDSTIVPTMNLATDIPEEEIATIEKEMQHGANPRDAKMRLAHELVTMYHSKKDADTAQEEFINVFANKELPEHIQEISIPGLAVMNVAQAMVAANLAPSNSEAKRLVEQGAVKINEEKIESWESAINIDNVLLQVGKKKFARLMNKK